MPPSTPWRQLQRRWSNTLEPWLRRPRAILGWIPITPRSLLAAALLLWVALAYGRDRSDLILLTLGAGGLALLALNTLTVLLVALAMRLRRPPTPSETWIFQTGLPAHTNYSLALSAWIPLVQIDMTWEAPPGLDATLTPWRGRLREEVTPHRRALADGLVRRFTFVDAFGFARVSWRQRFAQPLKVLPASGRLEPHQLLQQLSSGDLVSHPAGQPEGDLIEMRRYAHGDPLKRILWKTYARTDRLLVRLPERAIAPRQKTLAYLVADHSDESTAGTARAALESGIFGQDFLFRADGADASTDRVHDAIEQIVASSAITDDGGLGLGPFLRAEQGDSRACVLFAPRAPGPWLARVEEQLRAHRGRVSVIIGVDGLHNAQRRSLLRRALFNTPDTWADTLADLQAVHERLAAAGAPVVVLDRATGHALSPQHLQLLRQRQRTPTRSLP